MNRRRMNGRRPPAGGGTARPRGPALTVLAGCLSALLAGAPAAALELGEARVRSGLGQTLDVVVPYRTSGNERLAADCVTLVRGEATGLPVMTGARVTSVAGGRFTIRGTGTVREPLFSMHVQVDCPATPFLVRSYTIILDPAAPRAAPSGDRSARISPADRAAPAAAIDRTVPAANRRLPAGGPPVEAVRPAPDRAAAIVPGTTYRVRSGDTLYSIASRVSGRTDGVWQTARRLFAANPDAFIDGDMDRLLAGAVLAITDSRTVSGAEPGVETDTGARVAAASAKPTPVPARAATTSTRTTTARPAAVRDRTAASPGAPVAALTGIDPDEAPAERSSSPFKEDAAGTDAAPATAAAPAAAPLPVTGAAATADANVETSSFNPFLAALLGGGLGLLLVLAMFRSAIRDLFRRSPTPAAAADEDTIATPVTAPIAIGEDPTGFFTDFTEEPAPDGADSGIHAVRATGKDPDVFVAEEDWTGAGEPLRSLDLDLDLDLETADDDTLDITAEEPAASPMALRDPGDDAGGPEPRREPAEPTPDERFEESMIVEVDTGAELVTAASADEAQPGDEAPADDTGLATAVDLKMLEEDYEQEFTATQRLERQLADAALELDREIAAHAEADGPDDSDAPADTVEEPLVAAPRQRSA